MSKKQKNCLKNQLFLILENIRSLYNVGVIFRTAEAAAVSKIFLVGSTGIIIPKSPKDKRKPLLNLKLAKTALGTEKQVFWQHFWSAKEAINNINYHGHSPWYPQATPSASLFSCASSTAKSRGFRASKIKRQNSQTTIFALEQTTKAKNYTKVKYKLPLALVVGNEKTGIKKETLNLADQTIQIPMLGQHKSLNVASACGIALFEVLRQTMATLDRF